MTFETIDQVRVAFFWSSAFVREEAFDLLRLKKNGWVENRLVLLLATLFAVLCCHCRIEFLKYTSLVVGRLLLL